MANAGIQTLVEALNRLVENQQQVGFCQAREGPRSLQSREPSRGVAEVAGLEVFI